MKHSARLGSKKKFSMIHGSSEKSLSKKRSIAKESLSSAKDFPVFVYMCMPVTRDANRKRGSASYIVREVLSVRERERDTDRQRERERDGSDVTIVALKLAMNLHFPLPKIRTIGDELTLSLAKNSHFSFLPSHFPSLPSRRGHLIVALKFAMSSHFPLPKNVSPSLFPSFKWCEPRDE